MFDSYGYPTSIRYDGGPHFRKEFIDMLDKFSIPETPLSPYNHASNGLAERHVGVVKLLLKKCTASKQDFRSALNRTLDQLSVRLTPLRGMTDIVHLIYFLEED